MKSFLILLVALTLPFFGLAQNTSSTTKVETVTMKVVLVEQMVQNDVMATPSLQMARIHKFRNDRVKKALVFTTKRNKPKLT